MSLRRIRIVRSSAAALLIAVYVACAATGSRSAPSATADARVDFGREVRPLLADRCFACHGPDEGKRKAGLRLDTQEGSRAELESGARAIVPGDVAASELVRRIELHDDDAMPPASSKLALSAEERATLRRWVEQGGDYAAHWAFVPPRDVTVPAVADAGWARDPIDALVLAELEQMGLRPAPACDPVVLLRRASHALTGLPPTPEQADAFANDPSRAHFERLVDAMLASEAAAEHMATPWLDLARFADTHGYQSDRGASWWPWRDWLLHALRADLPYDQFVERLVAGDLRPDATVEDRVATAFFRMHRMTEEGGSIAEEFRQEGIADRVATFGASFLGLTLECARCHDHKFDPVPQHDFYALAAMFGDGDENGLLSYAMPQQAPPPFVRLQDAGQLAREQELLAAVAQAEAAYARAIDAAKARLATVRLAADALALPAPDAHWTFEALEAGAFANAIGKGRPALLDRKRPEQLGSVTACDGPRGQAIAFDGDGGVLLDGERGPARFEPVSLAFWIRLGERNARAAVVQASGFHTQDADASGLELEVVDGHLRFSAIHFWPGSAASVRTKAPLPTGAWMHAVATWDGSGRAAGLRLWLDGEEADVEVVRDALDGPLATHALEVGSRSRGSGLRGGAIDELRLWRSCLTPMQARGVALADGIAPTKPAPATELEEHFALAMDAEALQAAASLRTAREQLAAHRDAIAALPCLAHSPWKAETFVLTRGAYDQPDRLRPVAAGAIEAVLPFDERLPRDRAGLVHWLFDEQNPLTARVAVDRLWAQVFGKGLVGTPENFGLQGEAPESQAVLDRLAYDFAHDEGQSRWSQRAILRRLVLSATFSQDAAHRSDDDGVRLSRGPSRRLSAEALRDQALMAAGLLAPRFGGPSVRPWQPDGLWAEAGQTGSYTPSAGDDAHRRSLYSFRKRTVPVPDLLVFDAGSRETCMPRRLSTDTPLQALVLANDPVFVECAVALGGRVARERTTTDERIERAFRLVATRMPTAAEREALTALFASRRARYAEDLDAARALCGEPDAECAALVLVALAVFSSDAAVVLR